MTICEVRCHRLTAPLHTPFVTALRRTTSVTSTIVEVVDTDGARGFGEAPEVWRVTGESAAGSAACLEGPLADVVRDRSVDDLEDLTQEVATAVVGNGGAKAALDVALHDLAARRLGVSLPHWLGTSRLHVRTDVTLAVADANSLSAAALARVSEGFTVLKLKVGADPEGDVARVRAVRAAVGPDVRIRVDANQGWTVRQAVRAIRDLEDAGVDLEFVEQPVMADNLTGLASVTAQVDTPIMADEAVFGLRDLIRVIEYGAADLVNVKLAKCGGLTQATTMFRLAASHGMGTMVGSMMETHIGVGAAASLAAALGTTCDDDLDAAWWTARSPVIGGLRYQDGVVWLPDAPGLGIEGLR